MAPGSWALIFFLGGGEGFGFWRVGVFGTSEICGDCKRIMGIPIGVEREVHLHTWILQSGFGFGRVNRQGRRTPTEFTKSPA